MQTQHEEIGNKDIVIFDLKKRVERVQLKRMILAIIFLIKRF